MLAVTPETALVQPTPALQRERGTEEPVTGILLAGGRSERMGRDKAWVELAGRPLVHWVLDALQAATDTQVIVAREGQENAGRLAALGLPLIVDHLPARGPLTGIHAGLRAIDTDLAIVVACDMPLVRPELLTYLAGAVGSWQAAVPYVGEGAPPAELATAGPAGPPTARSTGLQPLVAAYRRTCVEPLERLLAIGSLPTTALISVIRARIIHPQDWRRIDADGRSFLNVNTPEDLVAAARLLNQA